MHRQFYFEQLRRFIFALSNCFYKGLLKSRREYTSIVKNLQLDFRYWNLFHEKTVHIRGVEDTLASIIKDFPTLDTSSDGLER